MEAKATFRRNIQRAFKFKIRSHSSILKKGKPTTKYPDKFYSALYRNIYYSGPIRGRCLLREKCYFILLSATERNARAPIRSTSIAIFRATPVCNLNRIRKGEENGPGSGEETKKSKKKNRNLRDTPYGAVVET